MYKKICTFLAHAQSWSNHLLITFCYIHYISSNLSYRNDRFHIHQQVHIRLHLALRTVHKDRITFLPTTSLHRPYQHPTPFTVLTMTAKPKVGDCRVTPVEGQGIDVVNPIQELAEKLETDPALKTLIEASLNSANSKALEEISTLLYDALNWPLSIQQYLEFLTCFARWSPQQSDNPAWTSSSNPAEQQEVYDRLCHFYFLIDQPGADGRTLQDDEWFSNWLISYANDWGNYLNTVESFNDETLNSYIKNSPEFRVQDSMVNGKPNNPSGWLTFNQFFARELNPGLRPIASPASNAIVTCPADCTYKEQYAIAADSSIPEITVKLTHKFASVPQLLVGSPFADSFANGTFVHYFLGPYSYHRFHAPVSGRLLESRAIQGLVALDVETKDGQFDAPDSSQGGYEFSQARGLVVYDTAESRNGDIGLVAVLPIGMCQVSSVNMTATWGSMYEKGDEFGYFLFGGSDIIVLFQEKAKARIPSSLEYRHYGTPIAICNVDGGDSRAEEISEQ